MSLPTPEPPQDPTAAAYWRGAARGEFRVARCSHCGAHVWFPRSHCPQCTSPDLELVPVSGEGVVYSFTVNRRPAGVYKDAGAVVIAYVELAEGLRVLTNLVDVEPERVRVGQPVRAVYDAGLLRFAPREVAD